MLEVCIVLILNFGHLTTIQLTNNICAQLHACGVAWMHMALLCSPERVIVCLTNRRSVEPPHIKSLSIEHLFSKHKIKQNQES